MWSSRDTGPRRPGPRRGAWLAPVVALLTGLAAWGAPQASAAPAGQLRVGWTGGVDGGSVTLADPGIVVGIVPERRGTTVRAVDATDGSARWSRRLPVRDAQDLFHDPQDRAFAGHGVVAVAGPEGLRVLSAATGELLWTAEAAPPGQNENQRSDVLIGPDSITYSSPTGYGYARVRGLDLRTGAERWRHETAGGLGRVDGSRVIVGDRCWWVVFDAATGSELSHHGERDRCYGGGPLPVSSDGLVADDRADPPVLRRASDDTVVATLDDDIVPPDGYPAVVVAASGSTWLVRHGSTLVVFDADGRELWRRPLPVDPDYGAIALHPSGVVVTEHRRSGWRLSDPVYPATVRILDLRTGVERDAVGVGTGGATLIPGDGPLVVSGSGGLIGLLQGAPGPRFGWEAPPEGRVVPLTEVGLPGRTAARRVTLPITTPAGVAASCRLDAGAWEPCADTWQTPELDEGAHAAEIRAADGPIERHRFVVDRTGPITRVATAPDPVVSLREGYAFADFDAGESLARYECRLDGGDWQECDRGLWGGDRLAPGIHRIDGRATDSVGNVGTIASTSWREDRVSPSVAVDRRSERIDGFATTFTFDASDGQGAVTTRCRLSEAGGYGDAVIVDEPCTSPWSATVPHSGNYALQVTATDEVGNPTTSGGGATFLPLAEIDPRPSIRVTSAYGGSSAYWGRDASVDRRGYGSYGLTFSMQCRVTPSGVPAAGPWDANCGRLVPERDDRYTVQVRGVDEVGRSGPVRELEFGLDRAAPVPRLVGGQTDPAPVGSRITLPTVEVDDPAAHEAPVSTRCVVHTRSTPEGASICGQTITMPEDGVYVSGSAADAAGNSATTYRSIQPPAPSPTTPPAEDPPSSGGTTTPAPTTTSTAPATAPTTTRPAPTATVPSASGSATSGPTSTDALAALLAGRPSPKPGTTATVPVAPSSSCPTAGARGRTPSAVRSVVRRAGRIVARVRVPRASRRAPVPAILQGRTRCGTWRTLARATIRGTSVALRSGRGARADEVRVRTTRGGAVAYSAGRPAA